MIDSEKSEGRVTNMFCVKLEVKKHAQNLIWTLAVGERDTGVWDRTVTYRSTALA